MTSEQGFREDLERHAAEKYVQWQAACERVKALDRQILRLRDYFSVLNPVLVLEGLPPIDWRAIEAAIEQELSPIPKQQDLVPEECA